MTELPIVIEQIFTSPGHNYVGHFGQPAGEHPQEAQDRVELVAGKGIVGDRYFGHLEDYKGQITFFDLGVADALGERLGVEVDGANTRRNVFLRGIPLNHLIGATFLIQGITFQGVEECKPCFWMDQAFQEGTETFLKGQGGLRAKILTGGALSVGACTLTMTGADS